MIIAYSNRRFNPESGSKIWEISEVSVQNAKRFSYIFKADGAILRAKSERKFTFWSISKDKTARPLNVAPLHIIWYFETVSTPIVSQNCCNSVHQCSLSSKLTPFRRMWQWNTWNYGIPDWILCAFHYTSHRRFQIISNELCYTQSIFR